MYSKTIIYVYIYMFYHLDSLSRMIGDSLDEILSLEETDRLRHNVKKHKRDETDNALSEITTNMEEDNRIAANAWKATSFAEILKGKTQRERGKMILWMTCA